MANCKLCGKPVTSARVMHAECWEREAYKLAEIFATGIADGRSNARTKNNCRLSTATVARSSACLTSGFDAGAYVGPRS